MDAQLKKTLSSLQSRHIQGIYAENAGKAREKILALIPNDAVVGVGDSTTLRQLDILQSLKEGRTKVLDPFELRSASADTDTGVSEEALRRMAREATLSDVFLTGTNAIIQDGRLVNVDRAGNRVAGMFWGHPISIIVVGKNKIVKSLDEAFYRIRMIIAPHHIRIRAVELGGGRRKTPCTKTGKCHDCRSIDRACNIFTIIEGKPLYTQLNVVMVDEDLGLGWNPSWPQTRINKIIENYKRYAWVAKWESSPKGDHGKQVL